MKTVKGRERENKENKIYEMDGKEGHKWSEKKRKLTKNQIYKKNREMKGKHDSQKNGKGSGKENRGD